MPRFDFLALDTGLSTLDMFLAFLALLGFMAGSDLLAGSLQSASQMNCRERIVN